MTEEELKSLQVDKQVDARGTACPGPLLEAKRSITSVPMGGTMEVRSSDPSANKDVPLWAKNVEHDYLGTLEEGSSRRIFVRRGK